MVVGTGIDQFVVQLQIKNVRISSIVPMMSKVHTSNCSLVQLIRTSVIWASKPNSM